MEAGSNWQVRGTSTQQNEAAAQQEKVLQQPGQVQEGWRQDLGHQRLQDLAEGRGSRQMEEWHHEAEVQDSM